MLIELAQQYKHSDLQEITVQHLTDDGSLERCNHAGAISDDVEIAVPRFDNDSHGWLLDDSRTFTTLVCDKENCKAWLDEEGVWQL